jgi:hypothetical protein
MELTPREQKLLHFATIPGWHNYNKPSKLHLARLGLVLGVLGGSMLFVYGIMELMDSKPHSLMAISCGLLLIGAIAMMYDNFMYKRTSLSLIRKLLNEKVKEGD